MMTRRERILTALCGGVPDRPPISFDMPDEGIQQRLLSHYGANDKNAVAGIDGFSVWEWNALMGRYAGEPRGTPDGTDLDFWGNQSQHCFGLLDCDTVEALDSHVWPSVADFDFSDLKAQALDIKAKDMVVSAGHTGLGYTMHYLLRGNDKTLYDVNDEAWMACYLEKVTTFTCEYLEALLSAADGHIEVVRADDDLGTMSRLMMSPQMWRRHHKPCWKRAFDIIHAHGAKVWMHSCGYIWPLLEDWIEIGVDCWNPFPPYVRDNDHARLAEFRKGRLVLDGGVNHLLLVNGTKDDVIEDTRRVLDTFAPDGGLLIGPSQVLTPDMMLENIVAMFETVVSYSG